MPSNAASKSGNDPLPLAQPWEELLPAPGTREDSLYRRLAALGIAWTTHSHAPVFTVEEAQVLRGALPGVHTKNLFLEDKKGALWLVTAREELRIDLNALARDLNRPRFSFGKPELLLDVLGVPPGAVTPFAVLNDSAGRVTAVLDAGMLLHDPLNFHPLRNDRTTAIKAADLVRFSRSTGHEPLIVRLPERPL